MGSQFPIISELHENHNEMQEKWKALVFRSSIKHLGELEQKSPTGQLNITMLCAAPFLVNFWRIKKPLTDGRRRSKQEGRLRGIELMSF